MSKRPLFRPPAAVEVAAAYAAGFVTPFAIQAVLEKVARRRWQRLRAAVGGTR